MTANLRAFLVNASSALGLELNHLNDPDADADVQTVLLKDVIALRETGHADHSLALLDVAAEAGLDSDWINNNRAKALLALGRDEEALSLFQALSGCATEAVATSAREFLAATSASLRASIDPTPVLEEAIRLRNNGEPEASLQVLDQAVAEGLSSPWIDDNRARALVQLDRPTEALVIWQALAEGDDERMKAMAEEMASRLRESQSLTPLEEHALASSELAPELKALLDAAIALRESGQVEASLVMLDRCSAEGKRSPWLAGNQARALALLNRRDEAMVIWKALAGSAHDAVSNSAQSMLERLEAEQLNELRNQWLQLAQAAGESLPEVEAAESSALADLERPVLEASIRLRKQGSVELSLQLLEAAVDAGLSSPWIDDNRARALVQLDRPTEALVIWQALAEGDDERMKAMAEEMASRLRESQSLTPLEEHALASSELAPELKALLDAAIALRESGQVEALSGHAGSLQC